MQCDRTRLCDLGLFCRDVCTRGSVQVDPWLQQALRTQRELALDTPLNRVNMLGTHNSGISYADGLGLEDVFLTRLVQLFWPSRYVHTANQHLSLTDQLNMGIRQVELDVHYHFGDLR